jgi:translation elongation factor EF-Tu-like GTPase
VAEDVVEVRLRWLEPSEGGRATPLVGPVRYTPTAYFRGEPLSSLFSVVLNLHDPAAQTADLRLGFPANLPEIVARLTKGAKLHITEGPQTVAECVVIGVGQDDSTSRTV